MTWGNAGGQGRDRTGDLPLFRWNELRHNSIRAGHAGAISPDSDGLEQPVRAVGPILAPCALPQLGTRWCALPTRGRAGSISRPMPVDDAPCGDGRRDHDAMIDRHDRGPQATRAPRTPAGARLGHPASATSAAPTASGVRAVDRAASPRRQAEPCPVTRAKGSPSTCGPTSAGGRRSEGLSGQLLRGRMISRWRPVSFVHVADAARAGRARPPPRCRCCPVSSRAQPGAASLRHELRPSVAQSSRTAATSAVLAGPTVAAASPRQAPRRSRGRTPLVVGGDHAGGSGDAPQACLDFFGVGGGHRSAGAFTTRWRRSGRGPGR